MDVQPTQLRLGFVRPHPPMRVRLDLNGLWVIATPDPPITDDEVAALFADQGVTFEIRPYLGVCFPVAQLTRLVALPLGITLVPHDELRPLLALVTAQITTPATLTVGRVALVLEYAVRGRDVREELSSTQANALVAMEVPFVATASAWERLDQIVRLPAVLAAATLSLDGYLEISTTRPQLVEATPLPGLFRLDPTHLGLPLAAAEALAAQPGFVLEPLAPFDPLPVREPQIPLSEHAAADLDDLSTALAHYGARAIAWESGLGRRIMALAAIDRLDAWPALVCTSPSGLWVWQRHLDLLGHSYALGPSSADVELTTYTQLSQRSSIPSVLSIVFDSPTSPAARDAAPALKRLASRRDAVRIAIEPDWPEDLETQVTIMELLRPGEFRSDVPIAMRYPPDANQHAAEHIGFYLSVRRLGDDETTLPPFRRSSVRVVDLSDAVHQAIEEAAERLANVHPSSALAELLDLTTAGPPHAVSPKIIMAAQVIADAPRPVAVVTRSRRAVTLLRTLLRPVPVHVVEPSGAVPPSPSGVVIFRVDHVWPDLRAFAQVVVLDYPYSLATLDAAVGPSGEDGPATTVIHANGSIDDRLVVLATRRALASGVVDATAPPSLEDMAFLFEPEPI